MVWQMMLSQIVLIEIQLYRKLWDLILCNYFILISPGKNLKPALTGIEVKLFGVSQNFLAHLFLVEDLVRCEIIGKWEVRRGRRRLVLVWATTEILTYLNNKALMIWERPGVSVMPNDWLALSRSSSGAQQDPTDQDHP